MKQILIITFLLVFTFLNATIINVPAEQPTIQEGINVSVDGDTVLVQPGSYIENINYNGKNITVASLFITTQDTSFISQTVIDGNYSGRVVEFSNGENSTAILCGLTITNGFASGSFPDDVGGGIICYNSSPSLKNLIISYNGAYNAGGIFCCVSNMTVENTTISGNYAYSYGGGIGCDLAADISLTNVILIDNSASRGGGIYIDQSGLISLQNVTISGNYTGTGDGSGIFCSDAMYILLKNVICSNNSGVYGIYVEGDSPIILFSDFYNNGGNYYNCDEGIGVNVTTNANGDSCDAYSNIQLDPLFVDMINGDYHLTIDSPCIDAGDPSSTYDPDGTIADMGAYYFDQIAYLDPPQNITVEVIGTSVNLSWDAVTNTTSYKVYSSDDPYSGFVEDSSGSFAGESWSTLILNEKKFYYVKAVQ